MPLVFSHTFSVPSGPVCGGHLSDAHLRKEHGPEATLSGSRTQATCHHVLCDVSSFASMSALAMADHELPIYELSLPALHSACVDNRHPK